MQSNSANKKMTDNKFNEGIQGLRGVAILLIFISHCNMGLNSKGINATTWLGSFGVSIFILISGFLLLENHYGQYIDLKKYIAKKIKKFYPLHIATLVIALPFAIKSLLAFDLKSWMGLFCNIFLLQAWIPNSSIYFSYNSVAWYLSLTVFFVVISPLILNFWKQINSRYSICCVLASGILIEIVLVCIFQNFTNAHWIIYIFPAVRTIEYMFGGGYGNCSTL